METANHLTPRISVIVPALLGYDTALAAIQSWDAQTRRDAIEIIALTGPLPLHQARAEAIRRARAPHIMIAEDHCLPERDWVERILPHLDAGHAAVGAALRPGNTAGLSPQASFLLGYGEWMAPSVSGPVAVLPGHNVVVRRDVLLAWGDDLERELLVCSFLIGRLRRERGALFLTRDTRMWHFDPDGFRRALRIFNCVGRSFGAVRASRWSLPARMLFAALAPAVAAKHWVRALAQYRRAGAAAGLSPAALLVAAPFAAAWGFGEAAGALAGVARVGPLLSFIELKPVSRARAAAAGLIPSPAETALPTPDPDPPRTPAPSALSSSL